MKTNPRIVTKEKLLEDFIALGVQRGDTLNVKASLGSIGNVAGGAESVIWALLEAVGDEGTIVTDSFVQCYRLPLMGENKSKISTDETPSYAGALANAMIRDSRSVRSKHPIQKFAAIGKRAEELMLNHTPQSYAYDVLRILIKTGGKNLKIGSDEKVYGIGTTHVALGALGYRQKRTAAGVKYRDGKGNVKLFRLNWSGAGHGFNKFMPKYQAAGAVLGQGYVGFAPAKITDMKITYDVEIKELKDNPSFQLCDRDDCVPCRLSWDFSEESLLTFLANNFLNLSPTLIAKAFLTRFFLKYPF
ncbi:AAC(3) family N-acetyltransferase [Desulfuromonas acetoxidans]|uniref:AAC(3) family N-acetyltransferase n=1 Tax=Desulfuromonas acetoxidans TaxID=891 RepID=UPI00292EABCE|nr:AAC(3) family N-acetyltransferase [Desulfuromonas acetoxidans]